MKSIKFLVGSGIFNAGETASFPEDIADKLVKAKIAEASEEEPEKKKKSPPKESF